MRISRFVASWTGVFSLALAAVLSLPTEAAASSASTVDGTVVGRKVLQSIPAGVPVPRALGGKVASSRRRALNAKIKTPFESRLAPQIQKIMQNAAVAKTAASAGKTAKAQAQQPMNVPGGSTTNFPGFVSAPFFTLTNPDDASAPYVAVTGDFNGDGKPDVVIIQSGGSLTTILNPGSFANFASAPSLAPNETFTNPLPYIVSAYAVDLHKSGHLDIVAADAGNNNIVVWPGNGDGTFGTAVLYAVSPTSGGYFLYGGGIAVGDFNGDGSLDVVAFTTNVEYYPNFASTLTFQTFLNDGKGNLITPTAELDANFNDVYEEGEGQLAIVSNDGTTASGIVLQVNDLDFNHTGNAGTNLLYISSNGDGTFTAPIEPTSATIPANDGFEPVSSVIESTAFAANNSLYATNMTAKAGATGQPTTDIVFVTGDGAVYDTAFTPGTGSFTLAAPSILVGANVYAQQVPISSPTSIGAIPIPNADNLSLADINKDGVTDLLVYTDGTALIFPNTGNATYGPPIQVIGGAGASQEPQPADYEGSGYNSFIWIDDSLGQVAYYRNLGGQFYAAAAASGTSYNGSGYDALSLNIQVQAVGDFDGDGLQDVVAYDLTNTYTAANNGDPDVVVGFNNGNKNTANQVNNFTFTTVVPAATLFNLDIGYVEPFTVKGPTGVAFVMVSNIGGAYTVTAGANGSFGVPVALALGAPVNCQLSYGDAADVNGDGITDIVLSYPGDTYCGGSGSTPSGFFTFLGNSDGTFQTATFTGLGNSLYMVKLINFNGTPGYSDVAAIDNDQVDGYYDILVAPNAVDGTGTINAMYASDPLSGYLVSDIIPGDYNNDGKQDLTLTTEGQYVPGSFATVPNTMGILTLPFTGSSTVTTGTLTSPAFYTFGTPSLANNGYYSLWGTYADFNGDGFPDLAVTTYETYYALSNPFAGPATVPLLQILPNQNGYFGPVLTEFDVSFFNNFSLYVFSGNFGNTGGADLLVTGAYSSAEFLNQGANTITLAASSSSVAQGASVTFTATVSQNTTGYDPTGTVTFSAGGQAIGAAPLTQNTATLTTAALPVGTDTITASYSGDAYHNPSATTATVTVVVAAPSFTLTAANATLTLIQGATGTVALQVASNGTFNSSISFSCSGAPSESTCTVTPSSFSLGNNQSSTVSVVVATTAPNNSYQATNHSSSSPWMKAAGSISVAFLLILLPRRRRLSGTLVAVLLSLGALSLVSGCSNNGGGSKAPTYPGTPAGQSTLTITATSGSITQTQTIALTIASAQ